MSMFIADLVAAVAQDVENLIPREYRFEVKPLLRTADNEIRIVIQPAVAEAARRAAEYPYEVPAMAVRSPTSPEPCVHH